jgi:hypothetical protein
LLSVIVRVVPAAPMPSLVVRLAHATNATGTVSPSTFAVSRGRHADQPLLIHSMNVICASFDEQVGA